MQNDVFVLWCSGPMVLLRLELGVMSRGCVGPVEIVCEHLRLGHTDKVPNTHDSIP